MGPVQDTIVTISLGHIETHLKQQELEVLGSQTLMDLRKAIYCPMDLMYGTESESSANQCFFFIEGTFYVEDDVVVEDGLLSNLHEGNHISTTVISDTATSNNINQMVDGHHATETMHPKPMTSLTSSSKSNNNDNDNNSNMKNNNKKKDDYLSRAIAWLTNQRESQRGNPYTTASSSSNTISSSNCTNNGTHDPGVSGSTKGYGSTARPKRRVQSNRRKRNKNDSTPAAIPKAMAPVVNYDNYMDILRILSQPDPPVLRSQESTSTSQAQTQAQAQAHTSNNNNPYLFKSQELSATMYPLRPILLDPHNTAFHSSSDQRRNQVSNVPPPFVTTNEHSTEKKDTKEYKNIINNMKRLSRCEQLGMKPNQNINIKRMNMTKLNELDIRLGIRYLYCHLNGCCEHAVYFVDIRLHHPIMDSMLKSDYPKVIFQTKMKRRRCYICNAWSGRYLVFGDRLADMNPCLYCQHCYHSLHYTADGELLYDDFTVFPYVHDM